MLIAEQSHNKINILEPDCKFIDASNATEFKKLIHAKLSANNHALIDIKNVTFMDSTGLGALVSCLRKADEVKAKLSLCGLQPAVRTLFELVRLYKVFEIHETKDDALRVYLS